MIEQVIEAARVCWSLGDAPVGLVAARENRVYRVDGPDGPFGVAPASTRLSQHRRDPQRIAVDGDAGSE